MIEWQDLHHGALSAPQLYAALALRSAVFVVEQQCLYQDVDGDDLCGDNRHLFGWRDGQLIAYARILQPDTDNSPVVIGRVIIAPQARGEKLGFQLMAQALASCRQHWPDRGIYLGAQAHLQDFYRQLGFTPVTAIYDEDGIPHLGMALA
ncbi:GNAT family N-acetyltransferase [Shimwellia pseudoproteus]|uniref:GNAT family N-acetyltransferase n=1 Tax=Shimwellia pseudoproteus TaxID=570012 RepID=UPI0018EC48D2|nr:GNAT family N-acetyltransferase [Shimwellia pseudoproteus]